MMFGFDVQRRAACHGWSAEIPSGVRLVRVIGAILAFEWYPPARAATRRSPAVTAVVAAAKGEVLELADGIRDARPVGNFSTRKQYTRRNEKTIRGGYRSRLSPRRIADCALTPCCTR